MNRGTTPTHTFVLPFDTSLIQTARVIYSQAGQVVLVKTGEALTLEGSSIRTKLTQEETLTFDATKAVELQVRVLTTDGNALASDIQRVPVHRCLEDEVIE